MNLSHMLPFRIVWALEISTHISYHSVFYAQPVLRWSFNCNVKNVKIRSHSCMNGVLVIISPPVLNILPINKSLMRLVSAHINNDVFSDQEDCRLEFVLHGVMASFTKETSG